MTLTSFSIRLMISPLWKLLLAIQGVSSARRKMSICILLLALTLSMALTQLRYAPRSSCTMRVATSRMMAVRKEKMSLVPVAMSMVCLVSHTKRNSNPTMSSPATVLLVACSLLAFSSCHTRRAICLVEYFIFFRSYRSFAAQKLSEPAAPRSYRADALDDSRMF